MNTIPLTLSPYESVTSAAERAVADARLVWYCSRWWAEQVAQGRQYLPSAACRCEHCAGKRKWPAPVVPPQCISYECHILDIADRLGGGIGSDDMARWGRQRISRRQMAEAGLHRVRQQQQGRRVDVELLVSGCERCEGLRPFGERYCMACAAAVRREMREAGYL